MFLRRDRELDQIPTYTWRQKQDFYSQFIYFPDYFDPELYYEHFSSLLKKHITSVGSRA
jgi:hypothetical protein